MPDITYIHSLQVRVGKVSAGSANQIIQTDFEINPAEVLTLNDYNEDLYHRFVIPANTVDLGMPMGTVSSSRLLILRPESDLLVKFVNTSGTSMDFSFPSGRTSIIHTVFTGLLFSNASATDTIKGSFFLAGD